MHRKNSFLLLGTFLVIVVFISTLLPRSFRLIGDHQNIHKTIRLMEDNELEAKNLAANNALLEQQLKKIKWDSLSFERSLIKNLNYYSDSLSTEIINLKKVHLFQGEQYLLETYQVTLRGKFYNTLQVINHLENELSLCELIHLKMEKNKKSGRRKAYLETQFLLTHIE